MRTLMSENRYLHLSGRQEGNSLPWDNPKFAVAFDLNLLHTSIKEADRSFFRDGSNAMRAASFAPLPVLLLPLLVYLQASLPNASSFKSASIIKFNPQRCIDLTLARRHPRLQTHDQFPFSLPVMSSTSSSEIIGGDYAGLSATFSSKTGELVPVPEHLVPESMLE